MPREHLPNSDQQSRILEVFRAAKGGWVEGPSFLRLDSPILQYHARMFELEKKGYVFDWDWVINENTGKRWKKYRLVGEPSDVVPFEQITVYTSQAIHNMELARQNQLF